MWLRVPTDVAIAFQLHSPISMTALYSALSSVAVHLRGPVLVVVGAVVVAAAVTAVAAAEVAFNFAAAAASLSLLPFAVTLAAAVPLPSLLSSLLPPGATGTSASVATGGLGCATEVPFIAIELSAAAVVVPADASAASPCSEGAPLPPGEGRPPEPLDEVRRAARPCSVARVDWTLASRRLSRSSSPSPLPPPPAGCSSAPSSSSSTASS
mmetsp:Transcript_32346/g.84981  ORF Transcript_32346/g.84981 Transcript_32346/m.84981 type:complete len:211 (-) Transcript_32346:332-964(-)